jgi:Peptidoglycan-binding protein, CsiV
MTRFFHLILIMSMPMLAAAQSLQSQIPDNWYQVEIIVFKQKRQPASDEIWPLEAVSYPADMVSISAASDEQLMPYSLSQLKDLTDSEGLFDNSPEQATPVYDGFLFEDRGNYEHNRQLLASTNQKDAIPAEEPDLPEPATVPEDEDDRSGLDFAMAEELLNSTFPQAFRSLSDDALGLSSIARSLRRSSRYDLLLHQAWRQPISGKPVPVLIQTGQRYDELFEVDGTLSFSRSRFLHLQADLWFTRFEPKFDDRQFGPTQPDGLPEQAEKYPELLAIERNRNTHIAVYTHRLRHSRRMRSSVLHYIDHPFFGVLVKIDNFTYSQETAAE